MGDPIRPAGGPANPDDHFQLGFSFTAGGGYALRSDGERTAHGPQFEFGLGPRLELGKNRFFVGAAAELISLQNPLFGRQNPDWVKTFGARFSYGREIAPWLTLKTQMDLGVAFYGNPFHEQIVNGIYTRENAGGAHFALGAGACFWKERICPMMQYAHDFRAYTLRRTDFNQEQINLEMKTYDTNGFATSLVFDIGKFF